MKNSGNEYKIKLLRLAINNIFIIGLIVIRFSVVGFYFVPWWIVLFLVFAFHTFISNSVLNKISNFSLLNKTIVFLSSICLFVFTLIQFDINTKSYGPIIELFSKFYLNINFVVPISTSNLLLLSVASFIVLVSLDYYLFQQVRKTKKLSFKS